MGWREAREVSRSEIGFGANFSLATDGIAASLTSAGTVDRWFMREKYLGRMTITVIFDKYFIKNSRLRFVCELSK